MGRYSKQYEPVGQNLLEEDDMLSAASVSIFILKQRPRMTMVANRTQKVIINTGIAMTVSWESKRKTQ